MFVYHSDHRDNIVRGSCDMALLKGRLLDVHLS